MKKITFLQVIMALLFVSFSGYSQPDDLKNFKMTGTQTVKQLLNRELTSTGELFPFDDGISGVYGLAVSGKVTFASDGGQLRIILVDSNYREWQVYEMYALLADQAEVTFDELCEETALLEGIRPKSLKVELKDASLQLDGLTLATGLPPGIVVSGMMKALHQGQNQAKIDKLNRNLKAKGYLWMAGNTEVSELSWAERKQLYGSSKFPPGIEYYTGGIYQTGDMLKGAAASQMVADWDWRNRHGKFWMTSVKNQGSCGSCWAFAATGATEAQVNLFFNQLLHLNLSEQDVLSCSGAGTCNGGYPGTALNYIASTGIVDEAAFPYTATDKLCSYKSTNPTQLIKIAGKVDFGTTTWPREEDALKKMIIKYGPLSGGIYDWSHAMALAGWHVVKAGDHFYTRDLNKTTKWIDVPEGSALIGTTVWIFKNSWGGSWGDAGYVYIQTSMANVGWTHAVLNPVQSLRQTFDVVCEDADGDGYYWWGLGPKPATCICPDTPDGDDSNPNLGPLDAYGNCVVLGNAPAANFSASPTTLDAGGSVAFTDLSTNAPTSWSWVFEGGTPATSTAQNPVVTYSTPGTFGVSLTVTNANGSSTKNFPAYITVNEVIPVYCTSTGNATREWISKVVLNGVTSTSGSSGAAGYQDFTADPLRQFSVNPGTYSLSLTPAWPSKASAEAFSVWIDFNQDFDFSDAGEQVLTATKIKAAFSRNITIPASALPGSTRMRVSMKRNALPAACEIFSTGEVEDYTITIGASGTKSAVMDFAGEHPGSLQLYPNPVDRQLTIRLNEVYDGDRCSIYSVQGVLIRESAIGETVTQLDVSGLARGVYLLEVQNGNSLFREKFVKH